MHRRTLFGICLGASLLRAQVPEEFNLPPEAREVAPAAGDAAWRFRVGAMLLAGPKVPGSEEGRVIPLPVLSAEYRDTLVLGSSRIGVGAGAAVHLVKTRSFTWDLGLGLGERRRESRADELAGMGDRQAGLWAGTALRGRWGGFGTSLSWAAALQDSAGQRATLSVGYGGRLAPRWLGSVAISATWANADAMATEFGVSPEQAAARSALILAGDPRLRPGEDRAYAPQGGLRDTALTAMLTYLPVRSWRWFTLGRVEALGSEVKASPLVRRGTDARLGVGFSYAF
ncbi:MAG TPA: MipA/OmpV family protein [Holophagaceae bacterium]|nr:MipA/OmpV family protein [Holophagaceae bacterium]